jgi:16S rRNA processing protein RimM
MGRVLAPFGVRGWVKVQPFTEQPGNLGQYGSWWIAVSGQWQLYTVAEWLQHGDHLVARIEGCNTREQAAIYRGCEIAVSRDAMPEPGPDEFYHSDLSGLRVVNRAGVELGRIEEVLENGAHPVLHVTGQGRERLLPLVASVVDQVDLQAGEMRVDWDADW